MMEFQEILYFGGGVGFLQTHPVHAVDVGHSFAALGRLRELSAVPDKGASAIGQQGRAVNFHGFDCGIFAVGVHIVPIERRAIVHRAFEAVARAVGIRHTQPLVAEAVDTALQAVGVVIGKEKCESHRLQKAHEKNEVQHRQGIPITCHFVKIPLFPFRVLLRSILFCL